MQSRHGQRHKPGHNWVSKWAVCGSSDQSLTGLNHEPANDSSQSCEEGHKTPGLVLCGECRDSGLNWMLPALSDT